MKTFRDNDARPFRLVRDSFCAAEDSPEVQFDWRDRCQVTASVNVFTIFKPDSCAFFGRLEPNLENPPLNIFCMQLIQFVMERPPPQPLFLQLLTNQTPPRHVSAAPCYSKLWTFTSSRPFVRPSVCASVQLARSRVLCHLNAPSTGLPLPVLQTNDLTLRVEFCH